MSPRDPESKASDELLVPEVLEPEATLPAVPEERDPTAAGPASTAIEPVSALTRYMAQLRHHAPISREEEHELALRWYNDGDADADHSAILHFLEKMAHVEVKRGG